MANGFDHFYYAIDSYIIFFYRVTGIGMVDYMFGTFCLSLIAVLLGELTISLAIKANTPYLADLSLCMKKKEALSIKAYETGDMAGYKALNKEATDAWGRKFFAMLAHSAAILWPVPFALGWMQTRFAGIDFPIAFPFSLVTDSVGYTFSFSPIYVLARIVFGKLRPHLPYFASVHRQLAQMST